MTREVRQKLPPSSFHFTFELAPFVGLLLSLREDLLFLLFLPPFIYAKARGGETEGWRKENKGTFSTFGQRGLN